MATIGKVGIQKFVNLKDVPKVITPLQYLQGKADGEVLEFADVKADVDIADAITKKHANTLDHDGALQVDKVGVDNIEITNTIKGLIQVSPDNSRWRQTIDNLGVPTWNRIPISYWKFDEGTGIIANDSEGTNHGTIYGATWIDGKVGKALSFDGVNDYVDAGNGASLDITNNLSLDIWVRWNDLTGEQDIISRRGDNLSFRMFKSSAHYVYFNINNNRSVGYGIPVVADTWYNFTVTLTAVVSGFKMYVNGVLVDTQDGGVINSYTSNLLIGQIGSGESYLRGVVDEVRIYNRALTADEVQQKFSEII